MKTTTLSWKFPQKEFLILKIEVLFIAVLAILIFIVSFVQYDRRWLPPVLFTILFLAIYVLISSLAQKWRAVEEQYHLTGNHLEVVRKKRTATKKEKALLKDIAHHKLDKFFLGGYLLTKKGRKHLLFFNTKQEVEKFESFLKKHLKR